MILSGDHIYRMDDEEMIKSHIASGAAVTIAAGPVAIGTAAGDYPGGAALGAVSYTPE